MEGILQHLLDITYIDVSTQSVDPSTSTIHRFSNSKSWTLSGTWRMVLHSKFYIHSFKTSLGHLHIFKLPFTLLSYYSSVSFSPILHLYGRWFESSLILIRQLSPRLGSLHLPKSLIIFNQVYETSLSVSSQFYKSNLYMFLHITSIWPNSHPFDVFWLTLQ